MKKKIALGTLSTLIMTLSSMTGNLLLSGLIIRHFSHFMAGIWFTYLGVNVFLNFTDLGLSASLSREIAFSEKKRSIKFRVDNLYSTIKKTFFYLSPLILLISYFFYILVIKKYDHHSSSILSSYIIMVVGFYFRFLANAPLSVLYGLGKIPLQTTLLTLTNILAIILAIIFLLLHHGIVLLSCSYTFSYFLLFIISKFLVHKRYHYKGKRKFSFLVLHRLGSMAINSTLTSIAAIINLQIPGFIIVSVLGPSALPPFALIRQICNSILSFSVILSNAVLPFISNHTAKRNLSVVSHLFKYIITYSSVIALLLSMMVFSSLPEIGKLWVNNPNIFNYTITIIMLITIILEAHHVSIAKCCLFYGFNRLAPPAIANTLLTTILSFILIPSIGILGGALAVFFGQLMTNNWYLVYVLIRHVGFKLKSYLKILFKISVAFLTLLFTHLLIHAYLTTPNDILTFVLQSLILFISCSITLISFSEEKNFIRNLLKKQKTTT